VIVAVAALISTLLTGVSLRVLRAPLLVLLTELCVLEHRARFWWRIAAVEVVVGTTICMSLAARGDAGAQAWRLAAGLVRGAAAGLLLSLAVITLAVLVFERQLAHRRHNHLDASWPEPGCPIEDES